MTISRSICVTAGSALLLLLMASASHAAVSCEPVVGQLVTVEGQVQVQRTGAASWLEGKLNDHLCKGDLVRAGERSRATVALINQAVLRIDQNTAMRLDNISEDTEERSFLSLVQGAFQSFSRKPRGFEVNTPYLNGSIEGTEFVFRVEEGESILTVFEGTVLASNDQGSASVSGGESVAAKAGQAPQSRTVVRPRDAAQWSLYYPPILAAGGTEGSAALRQAAADLSVGRVDAARASVEQAITKGGDAGLAYALRAVINVVQNQPAQALDDANQAVSLSPESSAAKIALSYAQQASFQIKEARDTLLEAVEQQPEDALAHARLAELQLMLGHRAQANASAEQAVALAPDLGRTQITLGFAALAEFRNDEARAAFEKAIALDSADPLPHLGLGLSKISAGDLEAGRKDIEVAVGLGSNDALLRSYLGKAYFEEKRAPLDAEQFDIAKELDPNDPTAYLYSGIAKQTENRPVEALEDLEKSIELNDNRAAYRGRLLLDKDRAARGTSLARAYKDLGFEQLGIVESTESMTVDPSNASAHRYLSDSYQGVRRHEIARVSELLQAQLLQDININPVQPSISSTNLNIFTLGGPAAPGFNEFTPLFQRNKAQINATGFAGNNDTKGGEAVVSGLYGPLSLSAGAFTYDSDGWRSNNDLDQDVYNFFAQWAITPALNIQAEFNRREQEYGDLDLNFDPADFLENERTQLDDDSARFGIRYSPTSSSTFLISYIDSDIKEVIKDFGALDPFTNFSFDFDSDTDGNLLEAQYIFQGNRFNLTAGVSYSDTDTDIQESVSLEDITFGPIFALDQAREEETENKRAYVYANITSMDSFTWTIGASYDDYNAGPPENSNLTDISGLNPKLGVRWDINNALQVRAAAFKVLKPTLVANRTIEPTQVAGFNQLFDDAVGTEYWRYGLGADWRLSHNIAVGAEVTWRDRDEPFTDVNAVTGEPEVVVENRDEQYHKLYLNWIPLNQLAVTAELVYDRYESEKGILTEFADLPEEVKTYSVPVSLTYFNPSGVFAGAVGTYVNQDVERSEFAFAADGDDSFYLVDVAIGYRLPKRRGIISLGVNNVFDEEFNYLDDSYREFSPGVVTGPYFPDRVIMGRATLNF